jgi:hypothetical protein
MIVSIFKDLTFATGIDYSYAPPQEGIPGSFDEDGNTIAEIVAVPAKWNPDCVACIDIDFDTTTETLEITEKKGKYTAEVIPLPTIPETPKEKHSRIYHSLIVAVTLENFDLEWEKFSDFEIGELITARVFCGNPHAEKALTNKVLAVTLALLQWVEMTEWMTRKVAEATAKKAEVDAVRNLFNLGNL